MLMSQQYRPFRRRQRIVVSTPAPLTVFTCALVVGALIVDMPLVSVVAIAVYIALGYPAGRLPTPMHLLWAQVMAVVGLVASALRGEGLYVTEFGVLMMIGGVLGVSRVLHRPRR
jgi:hypothetical protein